MVYPSYIPFAQIDTCIKKKNPFLNYPKVYIFFWPFKTGYFETKIKDKLPNLNKKKRKTSFLIKL